MNAVKTHETASVLRETASAQTRNHEVATSARKIRLLLLITGLATGGATNVVLDIASHFSAHPDFEVDLVSGPIPPGRNDVSHLATQRGITLKHIPSLVNKISPRTNLQAIFDIRRLISMGNYDIVHTHSSVAGIVGRLAAVSARVPVILHHVHGWAVNETMSANTRRVYLALEKLCARVTDRIIVVAKADIEKGLDHGIGRADKFNLIYNGIPLDRFRQTVDPQQVRAALGIDPHCKLVGMIGRLDEQKNPLDFILAARMVAEHDKHVQFLIVGDGLLRPQCEALIHQLGLRSRVHLLGFRSDVPQILSTLTITALSSLWEGLPITFLEAMSAGKPIVANNIDGAREVVINGETGFLVTPHRPEEMAARILELLRNESACRSMGELARRRSDYFSIQRMVEQLENLYKELHTKR